MYGRLFKSIIGRVVSLLCSPLCSRSHNRNNPVSPCYRKKSRTTLSPNTDSPPPSASLRRAVIRDDFYRMETASSAKLSFDIDNSK